jgi:hypothetical protein
MNARYEIVQDDQRFSFRLLGSDGTVLLSGLPSSGKIAVQSEVLHVRNSVRAGDRFVTHAADDGTHFVVLKDRHGNVLARSPHVRSPGHLDRLIEMIHAVASGAPMLDLARV